MISSHRIGSSAAAALVLIGTLWSTESALALSKEAAIEECRNSVGRPIVQNCMRGGSGTIEACRALAMPKWPDRFLYQTH